MYDMICKDKVVGAITWLKVHNKFYANIKLNEEWSALPYEDPLTLLADGAKTCTSGTDNVCDLNMDATTSGLPHEDSMLPPETLCVNSCGEQKNNCHKADYAVQKQNNHEMKCNDKEDSHVSLPDDHTPTVASVNVVSSTPPIHLQHSELPSRACGIGDLDHKKESHTNGSDDEQITSTLGTDDEHDAELEEDQAALDHRQELTGDALPSMVQIDSLENCIYQCAPGENNVPQYILLDDNFEVLAFPDLFPYGQGAYHTEDRTASLPICKYFQQRLLNVDTRFAGNIEYIFCAQYIADIKQIESDANLAITLSQGRTLGGEKITAGVLRNPLALKQLVRNEQAYKFLKNVRGSPAYWQNELYDVLAMLRALGTPTFF